MSERYVPTPEHLALAAERRENRQNKARISTQRTYNTASILAREWIQLEPARIGAVKVMTWNLLAQRLVRRELFPTSHCLKASQREPMLFREILSRGADILCLQEVDRLEKLTTLLENANYSHFYTAGPEKKHGCLVAWDKTKYRRVNERIVRYDEQEVRRDGDERARRGSSFWTKNIGALVALERLGAGEDMKGCIVATTHLFWHPKYTYERARQTGILFREVIRYRDELSLHGWPCVVAGDFNFPPDDPAYSLLVGEPLSADQEARLASSRVVHISIDPTVPKTPEKQTGDQGEGGCDHDRIITNARPAFSSDGLLTSSELVDLFSNGAPPRSAYDEGLRAAQKLRPDITTFGDRVSLGPTRRGAHEPEWTCYAHFWKTALDYIFILEPSTCRSVITGILKPLETQDLEPGLPRTGVCGSDHLSLCAEIGWVYHA